MLDERRAQRRPYPLSWEEQRLFFRLLPDHLVVMALFKVNTGCREQEVCRLQWDWEVQVPELGTSVFLVPKSMILHRLAPGIWKTLSPKDAVWVYP